MVEIMVVIILILSIVLHEVAHGYAANWLGDPTARLAGRLSANPLLHIDPVGSILIPGMLYFTGAGFLFGWAKPVPYNPYNLRNQKWGESMVAVAGPLSNILLAVIFAGIIRMAPVFGLSPEFIDMGMKIVSINVLLALFNIIPLPPLDGSKVIVPFLPFGLQQKYRTLAIRLENMGFVALFLMIFVFMMVLRDPFFHLVSFVEKVLIIGL
jgi:Zn-dependent protease